MIIPTHTTIVQGANGVFDKAPSMVLRLTERGTFDVPPELSKHVLLQSLSMNDHDCVVHAECVMGMDVRFDLTTHADKILKTMGWTADDWKGKVQSVRVWTDGTGTERLAINGVQIPLTGSPNVTAKQPKPDLDRVGILTGSLHVMAREEDIPYDKVERVARYLLATEPKVKAVFDSVLHEIYLRAKAGDSETWPTR